ncbi:hypothetical protein B0H14DRAFT_3480679 [Mycena olivaceomarginata]|nr:hypothetical protein B0H14DRAFT_3480679 [Mycena olivaceomarginata]
MPPRLHVNAAPAHSHASPHIPAHPCWIIPPLSLCPRSPPLLLSPGFPTPPNPHPWAICASFPSTFLPCSTANPPLFNSHAQIKKLCTISLLVRYAHQRGRGLVCSTALPYRSLPNSCVHIARLCVPARVCTATHIPSRCNRAAVSSPFPHPASCPPSVCCHPSAVPPPPAPACSSPRVYLNMPLSLRVHIAESLTSAAYSMASQAAPRSWRLDRSREMRSCLGLIHGAAPIAQSLLTLISPFSFQPYHTDTLSLPHLFCTDANTHLVDASFNLTLASGISVCFSSLPLLLLPHHPRLHFASPLSRPTSDEHRRSLVPRTPGPLDAVSHLRARFRIVSLPYSACSPRARIHHGTALVNQIYPARVLPTASRIAPILTRPSLYICPAAQLHRPLTSERTADMIPTNFS